MRLPIPAYTISTATDAATTVAVSGSAVFISVGPLAVGDRLRRRGLRRAFERVLGLLGHVTQLEREPDHRHAGDDQQRGDERDLGESASPGSMNITAPYATKIIPLKARSSLRPPLSGRYSAEPIKSTPTAIA